MKKILIVLTLFLAVHIKAQGLPNTTHPSPTASSLAQSANVPVSNYTGLPINKAFRMAGRATTNINGEYAATSLKEMAQIPFELNFLVWRKEKNKSPRLIAS